MASYTLEIPLVIILNPDIRIYIVGLQQSIRSMQRCGTSHIFPKLDQELVLVLPAQILGTHSMDNNAFRRTD
jgi:hypothetical protein